MGAPCVEEARSRLQGGEPLLRGASPALDEAALAGRWSRLCTVVARHHSTTAARAIAGALRGGSLTVSGLARATLQGGPDELTLRAAELGMDPSLTALVLRLTLLPVLSAVANEREHLWAGAGWEGGFCPACGSWPLLGEFRGLEQIRFLRCGLCASGWEFPRLRCPFCGTDDHRQLGYVGVENEEGKRRAATCSACRGYVKMVATLGPLPGPRLLVADLATTHLDLIAAERGYVPGFLANTESVE
jgi:FdhE protein